jgi:hypothetical protein
VRLVLEMVACQAIQTAIMFGGFSTSTGRLSDTWPWNGTTWTELSPALSPGGRVYGAKQQLNSLA